jgi:hypothetical protein
MPADDATARSASLRLTEFSAVPAYNPDRQVELHRAAAQGLVLVPVAVKTDTQIDGHLQHDSRHDPEEQVKSSCYVLGEQAETITRMLVTLPMRLVIANTLIPCPCRLQ